MSARAIASTCCWPPLSRPAGWAARAACERADAQVLGDGEVGEDAPALEHLPDAGGDERSGVGTRDRAAREADRAGCHLAAVKAKQAGDRAQRGGLARAVGAQQRDRAALRDREAHAVERQDSAAIGDTELLDLEQRIGRRGVCGRLLRVGDGADGRTTGHGLTPPPRNFPRAAGRQYET
jgi:hypothetical protein